VCVSLSLSVYICICISCTVVLNQYVLLCVHLCPCRCARGIQCRAAHVLQALVRGAAGCKRGTERGAAQVLFCVCVCMCAFMRVFKCVCVCFSMCVCVRLLCRTQETVKQKQRAELCRWSCLCVCVCVCTRTVCVRARVYLRRLCVIQAAQANAKGVQRAELV
jgi:hypothetical protein